MMYLTALLIWGVVGALSIGAYGYITNEKIPKGIWVISMLFGVFSAVFAIMLGDFEDSQ